MSWEQVKAKEEFGLKLQWMCRAVCPRTSAGCPQRPVILGTNLRIMFSHVQMIGNVWNECFESPYDILHHIFRFFRSFPSILFVWSLCLALTFGVEANVLKVESDGSEMSAEFQSLSLAEPNLTGFLGKEISEF